MANLLFRTCWNDKDYQQPTRKSFEADRCNNNFVNWEGYGLEVWNFNTDELINNYLYGYVCPNFKTLTAKNHNIWLYTISPKRNVYLVGYYQNAYFLTDQERNKLYRNTSYRTLLDQRIEQLYSTLRTIPKFKSCNIRSLRKHFGEKTTYLNLRVNPENVHLLKKKIPFSREIWEALSPDKKLNHRYKGYNFIPDIDLFQEHFGLSESID